MNSKFLITVYILIAATIILLGVIFYFFEPNSWLLIIVFLLSGFVAHILATLVFYMFFRPRGFEGNRQVFRRAYKNTIIFGLLAVALLVAQKVFDII